MISAPHTSHGNNNPLCLSLLTLVFFMIPISVYFDIQTQEKWISTIQKYIHAKCINHTINIICLSMFIQHYAYYMDTQINRI